MPESRQCIERLLIQTAYGCVDSLGVHVRLKALLQSPGVAYSRLLPHITGMTLQSINQNAVIRPIPAISPRVLAGLCLQKRAESVQKWEATVPRSNQLQCSAPCNENTSQTPRALLVAHPCCCLQYHSPVLHSWSSNNTSHQAAANALITFAEKDPSAARRRRVIHDPLDCLLNSFQRKSSAQTSLAEQSEWRSFRYTRSSYAIQTRQSSPRMLP